MCYTVYISTDSPSDLSERSSDLVRFARVADRNPDSCIDLLNHPNKWYVGSKSGCSCTFRHLTSTELGFAEPVDWFPEEQDEIDATRELYGVLSALLDSGCRLDLLDRWEGANPADITTLDVSLIDVPERAFRLFENHRFRLQSEKDPSSAD